MRNVGDRNGLARDAGVEWADYAENERVRGKRLDVAFVAWIRPELRFGSNEELIRRMDDDSSQARAALKRAGDILPPLGNIAP